MQGEFKAIYLISCKYLSTQSWWYYFTQLKCTLKNVYVPFSWFNFKIKWKRKENFYLTSIIFLLIGHFFKKLDAIVTYVNNLNDRLVTCVRNWCYNLIN